MLHKICKYNVPEVYDEVTEKVIAELRKQFFGNDVSLEVLSKLENLWREKLKATECVFPKIKTHNIIKSPKETYQLISNDKNHKLNYILEPLITSDRMLSVEELEEALQKKRQLCSNKSSHVEQSDGCNDTSNNDDETIDLIEVNILSDQSDDDIIDVIGLDDDKIGESNKVVNEVIEPVNADEEINSNDELPGFDPHWEECKNTVYCTTSMMGLNKRNMRFRMTLENGVMHINGKDYVFKKLGGASFW